MVRKVTLPISLASILAGLICSSILVAQNRPIKYPLITRQVDDQNLVVLAGNMRPEVSAKNDRGPVADDLLLDHMYLQLREDARAGPRG